MKLPLHDEVSAARRLSEDSDAAALDYQEAGRLLTSIAVYSAQLASLGKIVGVDLPGAEFIERTVGRFAFLEPVRDIAPRDETPATAQLAARRLQLQSVQQLLAPVAHLQEQRARELHQLRHQQQHLLQDPAFAEVVDQIAQRNTLRTQLHHTITDLQNRSSMVGPAHGALEQFLPAVQDDLQAASTDPAALERARNRLSTVAATVQGLITYLGLDFEPIDVSALHDEKVPVQVIGDLYARMVVLGDALGSETQRVQHDLDAARAQLEEASKWIQDLTG